MTPLIRANINSVWGSLMVEELIRCGVDYFCISPGSRSTPLVAAIAGHQKARTMIHFDERGAGFHALGYAKATGRPAVVVCTSGTAVANLLPSVVEASMDMTPMILLTADRPPELHDTGANQTIRQAGIFSDYTRRASVIPCPDTQIRPQALLTTVDQAVYFAGRSPSGPVHMNCMFREPLAPRPSGETFDRYLQEIDGWMNSAKPYTHYHSPETGISDDDVDGLVAILSGAGRGVMVIGRLRGESERDAALELSRALRIPTFPDILSGLRLGTGQEQLIHNYDLLLASNEFAQTHRPDVCLHVGGPVTSKRLLKYLHDSAPGEYIHIAEFPQRLDPMHVVTQRFEIAIAPACRALAEKVPTGKDGEWLKGFRHADTVVRDAVSGKLASGAALFEASAAHELSRQLDNLSTLFVASSMPIRDMDMFAASDGSAVSVVANRGASGIDGTIASATGFAAGSGRPVTLLIGDLALLHDMNSLAMLRTVDVPVTVIVFNNNGGGIFSFLPIAAQTEIFEKFFATPHNFQFHDLAAQFGLHYHCPHDIASFIETLGHAKSVGRSSIIELIIDRERNVTSYNELVADVIARIESA